MNANTLKHLNRLLQDYLGTTPAGGPLYKWFHSRDPEMFTVIGRLFSDGTGGTRTEYERFPQVWEQRWVLGMWHPPINETLWELRFRGALAYPRQGYYVACGSPSDPLFEVGVEPNERITMYTIAKRLQQIDLERSGELEGIYRQDRALKRRRQDSRIDDWAANSWTNFEPKLPGASPEHFA